MNVLKRSMSGMELELQLIDSNGEIANCAGELIKRVKKKSAKTDIVFEHTENMFELKSLPKVKLKDSLPHLIESVETVSEQASKMGLKLFGLGSYPGSFSTKIIRKRRYALQTEVFGGKNIFYWGHCAGFHYHYTLPRGVFDPQKKFLKQLFNSKTKKTMLDSYNMLIAIDPATATMMQSSPFIERQYLAKDSRMLLIRDPHDFQYNHGLFYDLSEFGELPNYAFTVQDLRQRLIRMNSKFKGLIAKTGYPQEAKRKKMLDFVWSAVKVNKLGTLEQRGSDMNHPKYFAGAAVLMKALQRAIQQKFYHVEVSDAAIKEPFKMEGNTIFIPPITYIKSRLQPSSAYNGFSDRELYNYTKKFFGFAKKFTGKEYRRLLSPLQNLIERRKTVSDVLIQRVKRAGYCLTEEILQEVCREIAIKHVE